MFAAAIAYLESKTPVWMKVCVALVVVGWMTPLKVRDWWYDSIDTRAHAVVAPQVKDLNNRIDGLEEKTHETNAFVKAMALQALGSKRYEEISLTSVEKSK